MERLRTRPKASLRTVEEAWLAGDALLRIKQKLPHGAWTPALQERGIHPRQARRFIHLRQKYPQIGQIVRFDSVSAALTRAQPRRPRPIRTPYLISVDDLWDWQRWEPTPLARRFLDANELEQFSTATVDAAYRDGDLYWIPDLDDFLRLTADPMPLLPNPDRPKS